MPEEYIINRRKYEQNGAFAWKNTYNKLTNRERLIFMDLISNDKVDEKGYSSQSSRKMKSLLIHYLHPQEA
jgi:hypothetical protein